MPFFFEFILCRNWFAEIVFIALCCLNIGTWDVVDPINVQKCVLTLF